MTTVASGPLHLGARPVAIAAGTKPIAATSAVLMMARSDSVRRALDAHGGRQRVRLLGQARHHDDAVHHRHPAERDEADARGDAEGQPAQDQRGGAARDREGQVEDGHERVAQRCGTS